MGGRNGCIATVTLNPSLDEWIYIGKLKAGQLNRGTDFFRYPGGKGINVSRVVHELGEQTQAFALAGGDDGTILKQGMERLKIPCVFVTVRGATRNNYKILEAETGRLTEINASGPRVRAQALQRLEKHLRRRRPRYLTLSGSLPPGVSSSIYRRWITILRRRGIPVVLDASGDALRQGIRARPWLIKPNHDEAQELLGRRIRGNAQVVQAACDLLRLGPEHVVLSLGAKGAVLAAKRPNAVWQALPPRIHADSAVGAGDSLVAGFLVGCLRDWTLPDAFQLGVATGTATALTAGTELCRRADVRRLRPRVLVQRLR